MSQWSLADFRCETCGVFEALVEKPVPDSQPCPECGAASPWTISAPKPKVWSVLPTAAVRGGDMKDRPPGMLDTRKLADGQSLKEWRKERDAERVERRHQQLIKRGLKQRRIQVG